MARSLQRLDPATSDRLREAPWTYDAVGATVAGTTPTGYRGFSARGPVAGDLDELAERVLRWQVQLGAGLRVAASGPVIETGSVAVLHLGPLPIPVRVVTVVDEPDRRGFVYGTLPGHPESGEELFCVERGPAGVELVVRAFSVPATRLARLGGPGTRLVQRVMTGRYLRSLG